jgi:hypothetical protein
MNAAPRRGAVKAVAMNGVLTKANAKARLRTDSRYKLALFCSQVLIQMCWLLLSHGCKHSKIINAPNMDDSEGDERTKAMIVFTHIQKYQRRKYP